MKKILSFDIGGTKIAYAVINDKGEFFTKVSKQSTPETAEGIAALLRETISKYEQEIDGVAISTAGAVNNANTGIINNPGNLPEGYGQTDFQGLSSKPVFVENDANSAGWAEYVLGAAKGMRNTVVLTLGTGVGAGIIIDGCLLKGKSGGAGEMHFKIDCQHRMCTCGLEDCLEAYVSGNGLAAEARISFADKNATSYDVIEGLKNNNPAAREAFDRWQGHLLDGLIAVGNLFDPEIVVLSGSLAQFVEYEKLEKIANERILTEPFKLREAVFKNDAGMLGAAMLMFHKNNTLK